MLIKRLILFLVRTRLGLKKYETFQFANQKNNYVYCFTSYGIMKSRKGVKNASVSYSGVSLNWLLDDECEIKRVHYP